MGLPPLPRPPAFLAPKRRVFISHSSLDRGEAETFIAYWGEQQKVFTYRALGVFRDPDLINSTNPEYVMSRIRLQYLADATVTIVLIGSCTHSRRYVDWELKASLRSGETCTPNGVLGIMLPTKRGAVYLPPRFQANWTPDGNSYAKFYDMPTSAEQLRQWIEDAYYARTSRANLIRNSADMMIYNSRCHLCGITH